jgi:hypothetical protein
MNKIDSILLKIFLYGLPVVIVFTAFAYFYNSGVINHAYAYLRLMNGLAGLAIAFWMMLSLYLSFRLIISEPFRDHILARLTFIRERDEREAILTGKATRTTFLTSLAILIFLFFLSCFQVSVGKLSPEKAVDGKHHYISLGIGFKLLDSHTSGMTKDTTENEDIFSYTCLPLSSTTLILILILWQIISYNYSMLRLIKQK